MFVVTGGGSGIGRALTYSLTERGCSVLIVGRRELVLQETAAFSPLISYLAADVSTKKGRKQIEEKLDSVKSIEGLVHNAGIIEPIAPITNIDELAWQQVMATNVNAPQFLNQLLFEKLQQGRVLHVGSGAAYFAAKGWAPYCVSKAALSMLTRCWQLESQTVMFANVMPGIIDTDMQALIRNSMFMDEEKRNFFHRLQQEGRLISTLTVARFLTWLLIDVEKITFSSQEWDIYDKSHHHAWLIAPHKVPEWE